MRTTLDIPEKVFKKTKRKAVLEGVRPKVVVTRALEREVGGGRARAAKEAALEEAMAPQLRFLAMNRSQRAKAFLAESKVMARFYAEHPEELLPDFFDDPEHEPKAR